MNKEKVDKNREINLAEKIHWKPSAFYFTSLKQEKLV